MQRFMTENNVNIGELDPEVRFLFLAFAKCALNIMNAEQDKKFYMNMAESVWETVVKNGKEQMENVIQRAMQIDMENFIKKHNTKAM
jgi:hypothetical protein